MVEIWHGLTKAIELIVSLDPEVMEIAGRSLMISVTSTLLASLICLPLGNLIHFYHFPGKRILINLIQTFFSIPTVAVGLFVFVLFSRAGPIGGFNLLFTPMVMVLGQMILITPILLGLTISALSGVDKAIVDTARSLGASGFQTSIVVLREARFAVIAAIVMGFGRAISEVGIALMVGGNIKGFTRVITTAISLETSKGDLELSIALGIILIFIALVVNTALNRIQQR
ncbi:MAG: ABC transporter permease subunit [Phycisphaerae bacterium]|nr:ABC transporter permease subunit [Phycisphaerae bacterium]NIW94038.1 ABC transporter permease subunit [Phycisphaerae bacterium]NIX00703.1 ABC transporter permease subunit [Phycisphaerae bacterium]